MTRLGGWFFGRDGARPSWGGVWGLCGFGWEVGLGKIPLFDRNDTGRGVLGDGSLGFCFVGGFRMRSLRFGRDDKGGGLDFRT